MFTILQQTFIDVDANVRGKRIGIYVSPCAANIYGGTSSTLIFHNAVVGGQ